jgi:hypothetical protein
MPAENETPKTEAPKTDVVVDTQVDQISEMLSMFEPTKESETDSNNDDNKETEDVVPKDTDNEEPKSDEPEVEEGKDKKIAELEAKIDALIAKLETKEESTKTEDSTQSTGGDYLTQQLAEVSKDLADQIVADDEEYEEIFTRREKFNEVVKRVQTDTIQGMLRAIPKIIGSMVPQYVQIHKKTSEFYEKNPDLLEHKKTVGKLIDETHSKNPAWDLDKIMDFVGGTGDDVGAVRKTLGLKRKAEKAAEKANETSRPKAGGNPGFAKTSHVRQPGKQEQPLTGVAAEIDAMIKSTQ